MFLTLLIQIIFKRKNNSVIKLLKHSMNKYKIQQFIGEGSFAKVYSATHLSTNIRVAIKCIKKQKINTQLLKERVQCEIIALKKVNHPNIIQLYEHIEDPSNIYLVMQYAERKDLLLFLREQGKFSENQASRLVFQILEACQYLHEIGIAHRDLKLANILLTDNIDIKITDFGLSKPYISGNNLYTNCGSPCFAAPQLIKFLPYDPTKSDLWSVGVICYSMLAGNLPFYHHNIDKLYKIIQQATYAPLKNMKIACEFLDKILVVDPNKRMTIGNALDHEFIRSHAVNQRRERDHHKNQKQRTNMQLKDKVIYQILKITDRDNIRNYKEAFQCRTFDRFYAPIGILRSQPLRSLNNRFKILRNNMNMESVKSSVIALDSNVFSNTVSHETRQSLLFYSPKFVRKNVQSIQKKRSLLLNRFARSCENSLNSSNQKYIPSVNCSQTPSLEASFEQKMNRKLKIKRIDSIMIEENTDKITESINKSFLYRSVSKSSIQSSKSSSIRYKTTQQIPYNLAHTVLFEGDIHEFLEVSGLHLLGITIEKSNANELDNCRDVKYEQKSYKVKVDKVHDLKHRKIIRVNPFNPNLIKQLKQGFKKALQTNL